MNLRRFITDEGLETLQFETAYGWEDVPVVTEQEERQQKVQYAEERAYEAEQRALLAETLRRRLEDPRLKDFDYL